MEWVRTDRSFFRPDQLPNCPLLGGEVPVLIHNERQDVRADQLNAIARFLAIPADAREALIEPLFADYCEVRDAVGEGPKIAGPGRVWEFVR